MLNPVKSILTKRALATPFLLRSTLRSSLIGHDTRRYQSQISNKVSKSDKIELAKGEKLEGTEVIPLQEKKFKAPINLAFKGSHRGDYERILRYTLIPLSLIPFYTSYTNVALHPLIDATIAVSFLWYCHYGFSSLIIEKIPKGKYTKTHNVSMWSLYTATLLSMCGIYELETENNGIVDLIKGIWNDDENNIYIFGK